MESNLKIDEAVASILALPIKKHQKIWMVHGLAIADKKVAELCGTNRGHVGNVIKDYNSHPEKIEAVKIIKL